MHFRLYLRLLPAALILVLSACATHRNEGAAVAPAVQPALPPASASAPPPAGTASPQGLAVQAPPPEMADHENHQSPGMAPSEAMPPQAAAAEQRPAPATPKESIPASPYVFEVTAELKDPSHPFYGVGNRLGFVVNGVQGKTLVVVRGKTYSFKVDTNIMHDFYLSLSPVGWGAAAYTTAW